MTAEQKTLECLRIEAWQAAHPRDRLAIVALAAWVNCDPDKLPDQMRAHTCEATMKAWERVALAIKAELEKLK